MALAGLLISVEPLIDMGRTAVNVSGSVTAGTVTSRLLGQTDLAVFAADDPVAVPAAVGEHRDGEAVTRPMPAA